MPVKDDLLIFDTEKSIAVNSGQTVVLTSVIPNPVITKYDGTTGNGRRGMQGDIFFNVVVEGEDVAAAADGAVVTVALMHDTDATPTTGGDTLLSFSFTANIATAQPDGTVLASMPLPLAEIKPYLGVLVSVATQNISTGKITAWLGSPITPKP